MSFRQRLTFLVGNLNTQKNKYMNTTIGNKFACLAAASMRRRVLPALAAGLGLILAGQAAAQSLTTLYSFPGVSVAHGVILSGNTLYGTTMGGSGSFGTIFAVNTDGTGFATLYSFTDGSDGAYPQAALTLSGNTLYGTASQGGSAVGTSGSGTVFAVNTDGTGFTTVHSFTARSGNANSDGASPWAGLILSGNTLYGTAANGGEFGLWNGVRRQHLIAPALRHCIVSLRRLVESTATELCPARD